jgi:hypothetical protein
MTIAELTKRVEALEQKVEQLQQAGPTAADGEKPAKPWWDEIRGIWAGESDMKEIVELGRKYRASLRPRPRRRKRS